MEAFERFLPGQESIGFHWELLVAHLHNERGSQVEEIGVANIREENIGKSFGIFIPQPIKIGFPEEIDEQRQRRRSFYPVVVTVKMIGMNELNMLHTLKIIRFPTWFQPPLARARVLYFSKHGKENYVHGDLFAVILREL